MLPVNTLSLDNNNTHLLYTDMRYHFFPKHYHESYSIAMLSSGAKRFGTAREAGVLDQTNLATMNPGEIHFGTSLTESGWNQLVMLFDRKTADRFIDENELDTKELTFTSTIKNSKKYRDAFQSEYLRIIRSDTEMEQEQHFQTLLGLIFENERERSVQRMYANPSGISRAIETMNDDPSAKHTLDDLAAEANMSKFHFIRTFKEAMGMTPHAYLNILRVERARMLMLTTSRAIADISTECGFSDQAHFTRAYKKIYGATPGRLIKI